ncbi:uncharacterized protein BX664DRAFT_270456, partial [Halteromyces radiatus]|uniref:uncharacterized protein n=1 Tax=Halteromyces radiatus TaxID=101107 RepID=UPI00221E8D09
ENPASLIEQLKNFRTFTLNKTSRPPLDMVPYQRLLWLLDSDYTQKIHVILPGLIQDAIHQWQQRLWRSSIGQSTLYQLTSSTKEKNLTISDGSLSLFESVESLACLNILCSIDQIATDMLDSSLTQLKDLKTFLSSHVNKTDRKSLEIIMLVTMSYQLFTASSALVPTQLKDDMSTYLETILSYANNLSERDIYTKSSISNSDYDLVFKSLEHMIQQLKEYNFNSIYISGIKSLLDTIRHHQMNTDAMFFHSAGKTRTLLGLSFIACYIPDYPADPTSEPRLHVNLLTRKKQQHTNVIDTRRNIETILTGNDTNSTIQVEQSKLQIIDDQLSKSITTFSLRPNQSQLDDIFVDLRYLQSSMLEKNVESLVHDLGHVSSDNETTIQREQLLQGNALQFIDRIQAKYPLYRDILQPLLVAVDDIKYGLRLMSSLQRRNPMDSFLAQVIQLLIRQPDVSHHPQDLDWHTLATPGKLDAVKAVIFERAPISRKWAFYLRLLIVVLQHLTIGIYNAGYIQATDLDSLNVVFSEIVLIWKAAQEYKRQKDAEKEQLYKTRAKKYESATDEERDEMDMKKVFADFNDDFADLTIDDDVNKTKSTIPADVEEESVLDAKDIQKIGRLHRTLFEDFKYNGISRHGTQNWNRETLESYAIAGQLSNLATSAFGNTTDRVCHAGHLRVTDIAIRRLESNDSFSVSSDDIYDFYTCENIGEAKLVEPVIRRFKTRVNTILSDWPEHAILQQLITICDRILGFSITSPVAKFLTGVELLLQKSEDWEAYAAKHVSIKTERDELIAMIVRWRQLELNCWPKLLAVQEQTCQDSVFDWWFHLYDAVNNSDFTGDDQTQVEKNTKDLLAALDQFMQSSSLVEFGPRLKMVDSFYRQTLLQARVASTDDERKNYVKISTILRNSYLYYTQFQDHAQVMLKQLRKPIEKDLKDYVKIATWKDVNIYALKQSAYKTHRQLHKCIRKYRDILNNSMLTVIANYNEERAMFQYGDEKRYNDINQGFMDQLAQPRLWIVSTTVRDITSNFEYENDAPQVKRHLMNLNNTLSRMQDICRESILKPKDGAILPLESFMTEIIGQIKNFQKETPSVMTDENKSMVKHQKLLKKKAMVDFLKELKRLGLKWRTSGTLIQQNADTSILFIEAVAALDDMIMDGTDLKLTRQSTNFYGLSPDMIGLWSKANDYYFRSIARLTHLRSIGTTQVSKDLSMLEVERSMAATEHMFSLVTKERSIMSRFESKLQVLQGVSVQLASLFEHHSSSIADKSLLSTDSTLGGRLTTHKFYVDQITSMLQQAMTTMKLQDTSVKDRTAIDQVHGLWNGMIKMQHGTDHIFGHRYLYPQALSGVVLLSEDIAVQLEEDISGLSSVSTSLLEIVQDQHQFCHILYPIITQIEQYLDEQPEQRQLRQPLVDGSDDENTMLSLREKAYALVDAILVTVQDLKKAKDSTTDNNATKKNDDDVDDEMQDMDDMTDGYIKMKHNQQFTLTNALHLEVLTKRCISLLLTAQRLCLHERDSLNSVGLLEIKDRLQQVYPFLQQYMLLTQHTLGEILAHHKSLAKMTYCLINSFTIILSKGFCMPEGASDEEGEADGTATGTGMGEGEGNKDVSEEIEDEEQVLGTQNEEQSKDDNKPETKEEKNGLEMENDFEGQLEDMEPDEDQDSSDSDSDSDKEDPDEQIGDVDDMDPDAVDDKMWGEEPEESLKESDKTVDQGQNQQDQKESDIVAQEEDDNQPKQQNQGDKADDKSDQKDESIDQPEDNDDQHEEGDDVEDNEGTGEDEDEATENQAGEKMNADVPEAETLDLPDDLDMDGGDDNNEDETMEEGQDEGFEDSMDIDESATNAETEQDEGDAFEDALDNQPQEAVEEDAMNPENDDDQNMDDATAQVKDEEGEEPEEEEEEIKDEQGQDADNNGDMEQQDQQQQGATIEEEDDTETKGQNREQPNSEAIADNQFGVQGEAGKTSASSHGQKEGEDENDGDNNEDDTQADMEQQKSGVAERGSNQAKDDEQHADEKDDKKDSTKTNPQRSLGDALESWRRRLGDLTDGNDEEEEEEEVKKDETQETDAQVKEDNAFEYVRNDEDAHDMQTMGNASADQMQDLKLGAMDEEMEEADEGQQAGEEMDQDEPMNSDINTMPLPKESLDHQNQDSSDQHDGVILSKQLPNNGSSIDGDEEQIHGLTVDESVIARDPLDQQDIERMREELENKVSEWREEGRDIQQARDLWQGYENLTHDLAMGLCEQLRLILEPTLATKLKGDYRTGKRLNMKKIIPYIASQFKKDKIWLRRTKPSKRQYQVMISVDDSKSMSESHSVQLAYETLSLISKAMSQLEVGDLCITSFGERIRLLHPFDQPFTAESGASVLQQFTFAQQKTYVKNLVESSLSLFENAQGGASHNAELWQLQLIISDGICEDHEALKALVRRAMDEHVMIIFIVVDNKPESDSILNMTNVKYATVNGKLSLQMTPYLETFPFQYFMVLRDINSLPEALSDALRQYFSFVAA